MRPFVASVETIAHVIVGPARDGMPAASRVGELRPSAATSSGAASCGRRPATRRRHASSRSTVCRASMSTAASRLRPASRASPAARRARRFSTIMPSGSSSSGSKSKPPGSRPSLTWIARIGQPASGSRSATPIVSSIRNELDETAVARPSKAGVERPPGSAGSTTIAERPSGRARRRGEADQPAAEDDDVRAIHVARPTASVA